MNFADDPQYRDYLQAIDPQNSLLINGQFVGAARTFPIVNPATDQVIAHAADGTEAEALAAVEAAAAAQVGWAKTSPRERSIILRRCFDLMIEQEDSLAKLLSSENGKSLTDAVAEVRYAAEFFRWFSEEAVRIEGTYVESPAGGTRTIVTHRPVGVAALITPWNFPAAMATRKIAPALAAGCTVVLRPASQTPLTAVAIAHILVEAGVPAGVVNLVTSLQAQEISNVWFENDSVRAISFTGSTRVGQQLLQQGAKRVLVMSMELGGNAPFVVAADADVDLAVQGAINAKLRGGGQACTAANRFYVHKDVAEEFIDKFAGYVQKLRVGPASDPQNQVGPLISRVAVGNLHKLVDQAIAEGGRIVAEAPIPPESDGFFFPPTVIAGLPHGASILAEEIFGPISPITTWDNEDELVALVNSTEFGLASYVFSRDTGWAIHFAEKIEAGMVGINRGLVSDPAAPFGGVKQSGLGREGGHMGIHEFTETQYFSVAW